MQSFLFIGYTIISPILTYFLLRRPLHVLFPLSQPEQELQEIKHQYFAEAHPVLARIRMRCTFPQPSLHPVTWTEIIVRMGCVLLLMFGGLPILLFIHA